MMPAANTVCLFCEEKAETKRRPSRIPSVEVPFLQHLREARGLTVAELARKSGVNYTTVMRLESREVGNAQRAQHKTAEKLAKALAVEAEELAGCRRGRTA